MIRLFIYFGAIIVLASLFTLLLGLDGSISGNFGPYLINWPVGPTIILVLILTLGLITTVWLVNYLMRLPHKIKRQQQDALRSRGMVSLARGLEAVAAGDPVDAQHHAKNAEKNLDEPALTRLLSAQAAQLAGDSKTASGHYQGMLEAPETEFLGLRGLYLQAMADGDITLAKEYAERAFKLRPNADWAFNSVYQLTVEKGAWSEVINVLKLAQKSGVISGDHILRKKSVALSARAYASYTSGDKEAASKDLRKALKASPSFAPAATLAAQIEQEKGQKSRAAKILETTWSHTPHPAIAQTYSKLFEADDFEKRASRLSRLAEKAPERKESKLLLAQHHLLLEQFEEAKVILEPLAESHPNARSYTAMAQAMDGLYGEEKARPWLERAANAPLEPLPGVEGTFHFTTDGWRRLILEYGEYGRLVPPPLEEETIGLSKEEVALLTAPPVIEEIEEESEELSEVDPSPEAKNTSEEKTEKEEPSTEDVSEDKSEEKATS